MQLADEEVLLEQGARQAWNPQLSPLTKKVQKLPGGEGKIKTSRNIYKKLKIWHDLEQKQLYR